MSNSPLLKSSIAKKIAMALSGLFLLFFLLQHFIINFLSVVSADAFNAASHFMGYNPLIQFIMQPILIFGVVFHLLMGFVLEAKNRSSRTVKYAVNSASANSSWMSRNMIYSGICVLLFRGLHMYEFWAPEIAYEYVNFSPENPSRYFHELQHKFVDPARVAIYCTAFIFLALHLLHGFQSAFQSVGFRHNKYTPIIKKLGNLYGILIPTGFIVIAIYHYVSQLN